jgi:hypothetical protein
MTSVNPIPAALWAQFWFIGIVLLGIWILRGGVQRLVRINPFHEALSFNIMRLPYKMGFYSFLASLPLFFSAGFAVLFYDFTGKEISNIQNTYAILITLIIDNFLICYMVSSTGGSRVSPFTALFSVLPTISLFLRIPFLIVAGYAVLIIVSYLFLLPKRFYPDNRDHQNALQFASVLMNIASLILTLIVAYYSLGDQLIAISE